MKLAAFIFFAVVAFAAAGRQRAESRQNSVDWLQSAKPFASGNVYRFQYDSQIASFLGSADAVNGAQQSTHRLSAMVNVNFDTQRRASLRLEDVRVGSLNGELPEIRQVQDIQLFDEEQIDAQKLEELQMPCTFELSEGVVERIYFNDKDAEWSKNVKRAVLNLLQLNLKERNNQDEEMESRSRSEDMPSMFNATEKTIEGECSVIYSINKISESDSETQTFNVTKTIDFKTCSKLPTTYYGRRIEKPYYLSKQQEVEEKQLDRTTVFNYQLVGTPDKYAVVNVEILSQYVHKTVASEEIQAMQTTVAGRLSLEAVEESSDEREPRVSSTEEDLIYSTEFDLNEKRFYQYGDDEFTRENTPFKHVENKVKLITSMIKKIAESTNNKNTGVESETAIKLQNAVELLRMCDNREIEQLFNEFETKERELSIFMDACAIAGTRNTVHFLTEKIMAEEIPSTKAVFALRQLNNVPAISEKHIDSVLRLCEHRVATKSAPLTQACWLTAGSMIGQLCKNSNKDDKMCKRAQKDKYEQRLWKQYTEAETQYEKILALKTIGNAGNELSVQHLEKLIADRSVPPMIRVQAIDALRRLRNEMPLKIQRVLLPVFKNSLEVPEVRMSAFSMLMHTIPQKAVLDQIAYTLHAERSTHVKSFVVSCFKAYTNSPIPEEREMAIHLQAALSLAKIDLDMACRYHRIPIYAGDKQESLFINWASIFSTSDSIPKEVSLALDSFINGLYEKDTISVSLSQHNIEDLFHRFMDKWTQTSQRRTSTRGERALRNNDEELDSIFDDLKIATRDAKSAFGIINVRIHDIDQVILPLGEENMPAILKSLLTGDKLTVKDLPEILREGSYLHMATAYSAIERSIKIATSSGMPLRVLHTLPLLGAINGNAKIQMGSDSVKLIVKAQPMLTGAHVLRMEVWCPLINTGVESIRSVELNLPLDMEATMMLKNDEEKIRIVLRVPEQKTHLAGLHSLPLTFIRKYDSKMNLHSTPHVRTIPRIRMESRLIDLHPTETSFTMSGHFYKPTQMSLSTLYDLAWASENHIQFDFSRREGCAQSLELSLSSKLFQSIESSSSKPQFEQFYKNNKKFEPVYDNDVEEEEDSDKVDESGKRLTSYLSNGYKPRASYRHFIKAQVKTVGGKADHKASALVEAICDSHLAFCKLNTEVERTPMLQGEKRKWELKAEGQFLAPEYVREISELNEGKKHNKLAATLNVRWGSDEQQKLNLKLQGERKVPRSWTQRSGDEWRQVLATAFINKYDVIAEYKFTPRVEAQLQHYFELLKFWNYWNVESKETMEGRTNEIAATLIIDPRTRQFVNVSVKCPTERVRFTNVQLPMTIKPFTLVRPQQQKSEITSWDDMVSEISDSRRAECRVDGSRVKTFDSVTYKAPIGKCYSVIAKDCSTKSFVVLMKTIDEKTEAKNIKIVTSKNTIEVELIRNKLVVKVDGEKETSERRFKELNIEYSEDLVRVMLPEGLSVRFDGKQVNVKLSQYYKKSQCGLCGEYNGEQDDEFRMNDNSLTDDVSSFHRSYSMANEEECKNIYNKKELFGRESSRDYDDDEFESQDMNDEVEEYDTFDRRTSQKDDDEEEDKTPTSFTKVIEYNHKLCFAKTAVKKCPRGLQVKKYDAKKTSFACMDRSSPEGRRLLRQARNSDISSKLQDAEHSFFETIQSARICA